MSHHIDHWLIVLRDAEPAFGIPLVLLGLVMMFMGWQLQQIAVPMCFVMVGLVVGQFLVQDTWIGVAIGMGIGVALAALSHFMKRSSMALLGGLACAFALSGYLTTFDSLGLPHVAMWCAVTFGLAAGAAMSFIMFREAVVITTSFIGSLLLMSGLNAIMPQALPGFYNTVNSFLADYPAFFVPFVVGGPTLIGSLVQIASSNSTESVSA